jgi:hypothetical protein
LRQGDDLLFAAMAIVLYIEGDATVAGEAAADDQVHQVLQRKEGVATTTDEQAEVLAADIDDGADRAKAVARGEGFADGEFAIDFKDAEQVINDVGGEINLFGVDIGVDMGLFIAGTPFATWGAFARRAGGCFGGGATRPAPAWPRGFGGSRFGWFLSTRADEVLGGELRRGLLIAGAARGAFGTTA